MTDLQTAFEALMPELDIRVDAFGEIHPTDRRPFVMGDFYTPDQMRKMFDGATARAARIADEKSDCINSRWIAQDIAAEIRGAK